jgi:hypothetical protein
VYANRFLRVLANPPNRVVTVEKQEPQYYMWHTTKVMGQTWREEMAEQLRYLTATLDYLQQHNVRVHVVLPPYPAFHDRLPFGPAYHARVLPMLEARHIPITDLSHLFPDEEFVDGTHLRYTGQQQTHELYREMALRALTEMGTPLQSQSP